MMEPLLQVKDLTKRFELKGTKESLTAVSNVNFDIFPSESVGLIGESGSGKTTVGRCILRLVEPTEGQIIMKDKNILELNQKEFRTYRTNMTMIFQDPYASLNPRMSVEKILYEPLELLNNKNSKHNTKRVHELLEMVGLERKHLALFPHQLSGGEQQRVGIARALSNNPEIIILDEPVTALDLSVRLQILDLLQKIQKEKEISYLYISHDLSTVKHICHRVAVMYLSTIIEFGTAKQIFETPQHPYSKALLSSVMSPDPDVKRNNYELSGEIPSPINLPNYCYLYNRCPEATEICSQGIPPLEEKEDGRLVACFNV